MGRRRKARGYSIMWAESVDCVGEDRVYDSDSEPEKSLMDELQLPVADEVLIALRKAFSLTFRRNPFIDGLRSAILEIRRIGVEAMRPMPEVLAELGLAPLPPVTDDPAAGKAQVFQFVLARTSDIDISVRFEGRKRRLLDVIEHQDATPLLTTLRAVITDTFAEAHDEDQHTEVLRLIRRRIQDVLPDFNACLEAIEIEPIAAPPMAADGDADSDDGQGPAG